MTDSEQQDIEAMIRLLACPVTGSALRREGDELVSQRGGLRYPIQDGIPVLHRDAASLPEGVESLEAFEREFPSS